MRYIRSEMFSHEILLFIREFVKPVNVTVRYNSVRQPVPKRQIFTLESQEVVWRNGEIQRIADEFVHPWIKGCSYDSD